jgi:hypothetical protein
MARPVKEKWFVGPKDPTAVAMNVDIFWVIMLCSLSEPMFWRNTSPPSSGCRKTSRARK